MLLPMSLPRGQSDCQYFTNNLAGRRIANQPERIMSIEAMGATYHNFLEMRPPQQKCRPGLKVVQSRGCLAAEASQPDDVKSKARGAGAAVDPRSLVSATPIPLLRWILRWRVVEAILSLVLGSSLFQCVHTHLGHNKSTVHAIDGLAMPIVMTWIQQTPYD